MFYGSTIRVYTTNGSWNDTGYAPALNTWTHILFKRESNSITMHVNGSSSATWTLSSSVTLGPCTSLMMMNHSSGGGYASIDGLLNEVVFYTSALSSAEIKALSTRARLKELVVNGGFNVDVSGWTINVGSSSSVTSVGGKAKMVDAASSGCRMDTPSGTPIALTSGKYYLAKVTLAGDRGASVNGGVGNWFKWMIGSSYQGCQYHCPAYGSAETGGGEHSFIFKATGSTAYFGFTNGNDGGYVTVDDVSLVEFGGPFDASSQCLPPDAMTMGNDVAEQINAKSTNADESTYSYGGTTYKSWTYRTSGTFVVPRQI